MGKTIKELLSETGLETAPATTEKTAAARSTTEEVDEVLRSLGVGDSTTVKTASENVKPNGGSMKSMADMYEEIIGAAPAAPTTEKTASEVAAAAAATAEVTTTEDGADADFGSLVGSYFNEALNPFVEKVAKDLEAEAGAGFKPLAGINGDGSLAAVIGKEGDPSLGQNHKATGGGKIDATTGNHSPYSLKDSALAKEILKREKVVPGGAFSD
jgi:hypothetical protein